MAFGDGSVPMFDGTDYKYWKIRMASYLEAVGLDVWQAVEEEVAQPLVPQAPTLEERDALKANAKAKNLIYSGLSKEVFLRVSSCTSAHHLWTMLEEIHEGTKHVRNERYEVLKRKLDSFVMLPHECVNDMYSRLNMLVDEIKGLNVKVITDEDVTRKIISVLPKPKYDTIATILHQMDLEKATPTKVLGKISAYELYSLDASTSTTSTSSKNIALKAEYKHKKKVVKEESSDDEDGDENTSSMIKTTMRLLKDLNKKGYDYNPKTRRIVPKKSNDYQATLNCYNCGDVGHIASNCPKPKKSSKGKRQEEGKAKNLKKKNFGGKKKFFKNRGQAYVGEWVTDDSEEEEEVEDSSSSDNEEVAGVAIKESSSLPPPPMCLMAKGSTKVSKVESNDSDDECDISYESLVTHIHMQNDALIKVRDKNKVLKKANSTLTSNLGDLHESHNDLAKKYDLLVASNNDLLARHNKLTIEHEQLNSSYKELEKLYNDHIPSNTSSFHDDTSSVAKVDASTSCNDLLDVPCSSSCETISSLEANLLKENEKLKLEKEKLVDGWERLTKGYKLASKMSINQALVIENRGIGYALEKFKEKKKTMPPKTPQEKVVYNCMECGKPGHISWQCTYVAPSPKRHTWNKSNDSLYVVFKAKDGRTKVKFLGNPKKDVPKRIWVPKVLVEKALPRGNAIAPTTTVWVPKQLA